MKHSSRQRYSPSSFVRDMSGVEWHEVSARYVWVKVWDRAEPVRLLRSSLPGDGPQYGSFCLASAASGVPLKRMPRIEVDLSDSVRNPPVEA